MKRAIILGIVLLMPVLTWATDPLSVPRVLHDLTYITGIAKIDEMQPQDSDRIPRYEAWIYLDERGAEFTRKDRGTWDAGHDDVETNITYFKYSDITELYYGNDAIKRAKEGLPTGLKKIKSPGRGMIFGGSSYVKLPSYMRSRKSVPMIVFFKEDGKTISLVLSGPPDRMEKLYTILAREAKLNVKPPQKYP